MATSIVFQIDVLFLINIVSLGLRLGRDTRRGIFVVAAVGRSWLVIWKLRKQVGFCFVGIHIGALGVRGRLCSLGLP